MILNLLQACLANTKLVFLLWKWTYSASLLSRGLGSIRFISRSNGLGRAAGCPTALLQTRASAINAHASSSYGCARSSYGLYVLVSVDNSPVTDWTFPSSSGHLDSDVPAISSRGVLPDRRPDPDSPSCLRYRSHCSALAASDWFVPVVPFSDKVRFFPAPLFELLQSSSKAFAGCLTLPQ